ncbi:MAG: nucleoside deaminase [Saprospiraceae bacterium]|nr:nucleoside deaminase [Saprospiraceae bacterium]
MLTVFSDTHFMQQALLEAKKGYEEGEIPVGAVVVSNNRIIARAHNQTERLQDVTAHAEMLAVTAAASYMGGKYLDECTLYVTLEPCFMCAGALSWAQLGRLVYAAADERKGFMIHGKVVLHPKTTVAYGILEEEARTLLQQFFREKR